MSRFRKKPVEVDAMQWTGDNIDALVEWAGPSIVNYPTDKTPRNLTLFTIDDFGVPCPVGHWVIRESKRSDRFYPCGPEEFAATYEPVDADGAYETIPTEQPAIIDVPLPEPQPCAKCEGCGKVANSDDQEPWTYWENLPLKNALAVTLGFVKPVDCPACGGSGKAA